MPENRSFVIPAYGSNTYSSPLDHNLVISGQLKQSSIDHPSPLNHTAAGVDGLSNPRNPDETFKPVAAPAPTRQPTGEEWRTEYARLHAVVEDAG